jgi:hypothetical protein
MERGGSGMERGGSGFLNQFQGNHGLYDSRLVVTSTNMTVIIITRINIRRLAFFFI